MSTSREYDEYGYSELHNAVARGSTEEVRSLLNGGADLEDPTLLTDLTPLHVAALEGTPDVARLLIDKGARVNARCRHGLSPLMLAMSSPRAQEKLVHQLVSAGADFNAACNQGHTALHYGRNGKRRKSLLRYMALVQHFSPQKIISDANLSFIESQPKLSERFEQCFEELDAIEGTEISGHIMLDNLVMKTPKELAPFTYNPEIVDFFETQDLKSTFPVYGKSVAKNWDLAKEEACRRWSY